MVALYIYSILNKEFDTDIYSVEKTPDNININQYSGIVIGFPVIHTHPTERILHLIKNIERPSHPIPAYLFCTCGLYSANTLRIFAKTCREKNIIFVAGSSYRCAAADGILLVPFMKVWDTHDKNLFHKIKSDCEEFTKKIMNPYTKGRIPRFKLYSILNYPNKLLGQSIKVRIYLHKHKCIKCERCIRNCPPRAFEKDAVDYPVYHIAKCERCYRCIHHCPQRALSLFKNKTHKKLLTHSTTLGED